MPFKKRHTRSPIPSPPPESITSEARFQHMNLGGWLGSHTTVQVGAESQFTKHAHEPGMLLSTG